MNSRANTTAPLPVSQRTLISPEGWAWIAILGALFVGLHFNFVFRMIRVASRDPNWQHILIVPLISIYFIFQHRETLIDTPRRVELRGLSLMIVGAFLYGLGIYPISNDMFQGGAMILGLYGLVWFLLGRSMLKHLWFPIAYLALAIKISDRIWSQIAYVLQDIAAFASAGVVKMLGMVLDMDADLEGNTITLWSGGIKLDAVNVAEACSGLRMLMAFVALGVAMAFLSSRAWWHRLIMVVMAIPIALVVNIARVTTICILFAKVDPALAEGDFHIFVGLLMLVPAAGLFWLLGWILDNIVIAEHVTAATPQSGTVATAPEVVAPRASEQAGPMTTQIITGVFSGILLAGGVGATYALWLISLQPDRFIEGLGTAPPRVAAALTALLAIFGIWLVRRLTARQSDGGQRVALGMGSGVLATSLLMLLAVVSITDTVLFKEELPLRHYLTKIPKQFGNIHSAYGDWQMQGTDQRLPHDQEDALGTKWYISRLYLDHSKSRNDPERVVRLHVAYYTGTVDTVPHVAERCLTAGGARPVGSGRGACVLRVEGDAYRILEDGTTIGISDLDPDGSTVPETTIDATVFSYAISHEDSARSANVTYFFAANGKFLATPDHVRLHAINPSDRFSYYCKIEVGLPGIEDATAAAAAASRFLSVALPDIMACLPDWKDVQEGRYPDRKSG